MLKCYLVEQGEQKKMLNSFYILCSKEDAELFPIFSPLGDLPWAGSQLFAKPHSQVMPFCFLWPRKSWFRQESTHTTNLADWHWISAWKIFKSAPIEMYWKCPRKFHSLWKIIALDESTSSSGEKQTRLNVLGTNVDLTLRQVKAADSDIRFGGNKKGCAKVVVKDTRSSQEHQSHVQFIDACVGESIDKLCPY